MENRIVKRPDIPVTAAIFITELSGSVVDEQMDVFVAFKLAELDDRNIPKALQFLPHPFKDYRFIISANGYLKFSYFNCIAKHGSYGIKRNHKRPMHP